VAATFEDLVDFGVWKHAADIIETAKEPLLIRLQSKK